MWLGVVALLMPCQRMFQQPVPHGLEVDRIQRSAGMSPAQDPVDQAEREAAILDERPESRDQSRILTRSAGWPHPLSAVRTF